MITIFTIFNTDNWFFKTFFNVAFHDDSFLLYVKNEKLIFKKYTSTLHKSENMYSYLKCMNIFKNRPVYNISLKKDCCNEPSKFVINSIKSANNVINIVAYKINNTEIINELIHALNRGVKITMILDYRKNKQNKLLVQLVEMGASIKLWKRNEKLHAKFMIIDNTQVLTGSFNLTTLSTFKSHLHKVDLLISLYDVNAIHTFDTFFNDMINMLHVDICQECNGNDDIVCSV